MRWSTFGLNNEKDVWTWMYSKKNLKTLVNSLYSRSFERKNWMDEFKMFWMNWSVEGVTQTFGNHVGDGDSTSIRFQNGEPVEIYLSVHSWVFFASLSLLT